MKDRLVFCDYVRTSKRGNRVIIGNRSNGEWLRLTEECYKILEDAVNRQNSKSELLSRLYDNDDREYMDNLISKLQKFGIINEINDIYDNLPYWNSISFSITERCNLSCRHCCIDAVNNTNELITTEEVYKILDMIFKCNPGLIIITGGEPLLRSDFAQIIDYLKANFCGTLYLMTNGTLINEENAKSIAETFKQISISMDGYDEESCTKIRGAGVYQSIINGIKLLQKYGNSDISLSMTVNKYTCEHIDEFNNLNKSLGTVSVLRRYAPAGRGFTNREELMDIYKLQSNGKPSESRTSKYDNVCMESSTSSGKYMTVCGALKKQFYIGGDKYIYPCSALCMEEFRIEKIDNIKSLKEYMGNEMYKNTSGYKKYESILPENYGSCKDCCINMFCSGCPIYVYLYNKSGILDYFCQYKKETEEKILWS